MSDEDRDTTLDDLLLSEGSLPLTDQLVDAFLTSPAQASVRSGGRVMNLFVRKVLEDLHKEPVREVEAEPFGRWLETVRRKARLAIVDIAAAIGKDASYVERLESGGIWPWASDPYDIAAVISLFRLHIDAATALIQKSFALSKVYVSGDVIARAHGGKMTLGLGVLERYVQGALPASLVVLVRLVAQVENISKRRFMTGYDKRQLAVQMWTRQ